MAISDEILAIILQLVASILELYVGIERRWAHYVLHQPGQAARAPGIRTPQDGDTGGRRDNGVRQPPHQRGKPDGAVSKIQQNISRHNHVTRAAEQAQNGLQGIQGATATPAFSPIPEIRNYDNINNIVRALGPGFTSRSKPTSRPSLGRTARRTIASTATRPQGLHGLVRRPQRTDKHSVGGIQGTAKSQGLSNQGVSSAGPHLNNQQRQSGPSQQPTPTNLNYIGAFENYLAQNQASGSNNGRRNPVRPTGSYVSASGLHVVPATWCPVNGIITHTDNHISDELESLRLQRRPAATGTRAGSGRIDVDLTTPPPPGDS